MAKKIIFYQKGPSLCPQNLTKKEKNFLLNLDKFEQKREKRSKKHDKNGILPPKWPFLDPQKLTKRAKIVFSLKLPFLHFLAKFKWKITQKSKNITKKSVFEPKRLIFRPSKTDQKRQNWLFSQNWLFTHFNHI